MILNYWHFIFAVFVLFFSFRKGLKGAVVVFVISLPFYSVSLAEFQFGGYYLKAAELFFLVVFICFCFSPKRVIDFPVILFCFLFAFPFIFSLILNYFSFEPVFVWEIDPEKRVYWWDKLVFKSSLSVSNITQLMYVLFSLCVFVLGARIKDFLDSSSFANVVKWSVFLVSLIGLFQLISYYLGVYDIYLNVFYNYFASDFNRLAFHELGGVKRINSVFTEPSVYGFYVVSSFAVLLALKGWGGLASKRIIFSGLIGFVSLSGTFYIGFAVILFFVFMASGVQYKFIFGVLLAAFVLLLIPVAESSFFDQLIAQKSASFEERLFFGVQLPLENIIKSPFFGFSFGTDRPTTLLFNLIISIGFVGVALVCLAFYFIGNRYVYFYLLFWMVLGFLIPDLTLYFAWFYFGAVYSYTKIYSGSSAGSHGRVNLG